MLSLIDYQVKLRLSIAMDEIMNSVSAQNKSAINGAISRQVLPQIQNAFKAGSGSLTQKG